MKRTIHKLMMVALGMLLSMNVKAGDYCSIGGINYYLSGNEAMVASSNCYVSITIPQTIMYNDKTYSVTSIGKSAFRGCSDLTAITIPNSVTSIGEAAFGDCYSLTSLTIGNGVTSIGEWAFSGCSGLTSLTIPNSVKSIGNYAFYGCSGLTSLTIPNSVKSIGRYAFRGCI